MSIFAGGFSLEAAEAVAADGAIESDDVFELLASLVARSLVVADTDGDETRYRLLETIRQYAQERLDGSGDGDRLRAVHAAYFAGFAEAAITNAVGPDGIRWERRLEGEFDNVRAALTWATDTHDLDTALRLVAVWDAPVQLWDVALISTIIWVAEVVLAIPGASEHPKYPAALAVTASIASMQSDQELAAAPLRRGRGCRAAPRHRAEHPHLVCPSQLRAGAGQPRGSRRARRGTESRSHTPAATTRGKRRRWRRRHSRTPWRATPPWRLPTRKKPWR